MGCDRAMVREQSDSNKLIFVVDDEADIRTIAELGLSLDTDWSIVTLASGQESVSRAASDRPDAILLDVMMPDMDGLATLQQLQADEQTCDIPVIFLTAKAQAGDRRNYYAAGVKGVITKPFDPTALAGQIEGFLGWRSVNDDDLGL